MTKLDLNRDGEVSGEEILKVLSNLGSSFSVQSNSSSVDNVINKLI